ncbi:hypothetical protein [Desulfosporosinus sp. OT]|uniref:hypothetical protein n=1 Tax=Desulfosporosinus sp. OT TaxID=913865 RepID=UPI0002239C96|nr:hypothetical protein [Desulfosporosinus sp. OT]EGW40144.1 hypothetical protein DOT_1945 [Desulfosporosinus sp. OT]
MFHTNSSDVLNQTFTVIQLLAPIYALVFGIIGARMLIEKGLKKIFPNYNPKKGRGKGKSAKNSSTRTNSKRKSTKKELASYMIGAKAPAKRNERITRLLTEAMNGEVHQIKDKVYISYDSKMDRTEDGRPQRTNLVFDKSRNTRFKKIGKTIEFSYD